MSRVVLALTALTLVVCGTSTVTAESKLWVVNTDYENPAEISSMDLESPWPIVNDLAQICPDPLLREFDGLFYVVGRSSCGDVEVLDPENNFNLLQSFSVGADLNPQDIALLSSTRAYVTRYDSNWILEVNPSTGAIVDSVSLDVFADDDGSAELSRMFYVAPYLYVQVQRLDRTQFFTPVGDSYLAVIDPDTGALVDIDPKTSEVDGILLTGTNPFGEMWFDEANHELWISEVGSFGVFDGGVDRVNTDSWTASGFVTSEVDLAGDVLDFAVDDANRVFVLIADATFATCVQAVDPASGVVDETVLCAAGYDFADLVVSDAGLLYLADRAASDYGVRVFDAEDGTELTGMAIGTGNRKPVQLLLIEEDDPAAVADATNGTLPAILATPNPSSGSVLFELENKAPVRLEILDAQGRHVKTLRSTGRDRGTSNLIWEGRDARGERISPGVYWARIEHHDGSFEVARIVRVH